MCCIHCNVAKYTKTVLLPQAKIETVTASNKSGMFQPAPYPLLAPAPAPINVYMA